jgi:hypothetical protein
VGTNISQNEKWRQIKGGRQGRHQYKYKKWQTWHQEQYKIGHQ